MSNVAPLRRPDSGKEWTEIDINDQGLVEKIKRGLELSTESKAKRAKENEELKAIKASLRSDGVHPKAWSLLLALKDMQQGEVEHLLDCLPKVVLMSGLKAQRELKFDG